MLQVATRPPGPALYGKTHLLSQADFRTILLLVRAKARTMQPAVEVRSVEVVTASEVEVHASDALVPGNYRLTEPIEYGFSLRRGKNGWRIIHYGRAITVSTTGLTKRCSQPLAAAMRSFHMTSTLPLQINLALTSGG